MSPTECMRKKFVPNLNDKKSKMYAIFVSNLWKCTRYILFENKNKLRFPILMLFLHLFLRGSPRGIVTPLYNLRFLFGTLDFFDDGCQGLLRKRLLCWLFSIVFCNFGVKVLFCVVLHYTNVNYNNNKPRTQPWLLPLRTELVRTGSFRLVLLRIRSSFHVLDKSLFIS